MRGMGYDGRMTFFQRVKRTVYRNTAIVFGTIAVLTMIHWNADNNTTENYFPHGHRAATSQGAWH